MVTLLPAAVVTVTAVKISIFTRAGPEIVFVAMAAQISRGFALALFVALVFVSTTGAQFFGKGKGGGGLSGPGGADGGKKKAVER